MKSLIAVLLFSTACLAEDRPAVAPQYEAPASTVEQYAAPANDQYGAPSAPIAAAAPAVDTYGVPAAAPVQDEYGSPQAPVIAPQADSYGSPAAPVETAPAPVGSQGYYYYYYPVRENAPAVAEESDDGLLGGLLGGGLLSALLGKKLLLVFLGITAFLVVTAFGLSFTIGKRSLDESASRAIKGISPYMTEGNLVFLADFVRNAIEKFD
eukprot:TRINITY_DN2045_c0_g1_i1.p1 TRINITY_DN2045_c0_g1~~TRINITY_DN2045_c0_g1_i1.p1  ORF type:complete len:210 (-),score=52.85 TRINITY_DN2045_c0_g1_i1:1582-2211(-)